MRQRLRHDVVEVDPPVDGFSEEGRLERIQSGDEQAFEELFKTFYPGLCEFIQGYVHSPEMAEELVQTIFLRLWEKRESWIPAAGVRAYLFAACRNQALDHLKHQRVVERISIRKKGAEAVAPARAMPPDEVVEATELADALRRAVEDLPERRRAVVILRWQHHLTNREIARTLGISVKGVEAHVTRALVALRKRLRPFKP